MEDPDDQQKRQSLKDKRDRMHQCMAELRSMVQHGSPIEEIQANDNTFK